MKAIVWFLNIVQFLIAYFISYALYFYGILELLPPETGLIGKGVWPAAAIGMALLPWKYYNRLSNYIIAQITNIKTPEINVSNKTTPKQSKLLYTFFFGYAALKWRRLFRTLIVLPVFAILIGFSYNGIRYYNDYYEDMMEGIEEKGDGKSLNSKSPNFGIYYYRLENNLEPYKKVVEDTGIFGYIESLEKKRNVRIGQGLLLSLGIFIFFGLLSWLIKPFVVKEG